MALEGFGIEIPDGDAEKITTVGDAIKYIEEELLISSHQYKFNFKSYPPFGLAG